MTNGPARISYHRCVLDLNPPSDQECGSVCIQMMGRLFPHHVGHYLGLDTHDTMAIERNTVLSPGMVVTIEPGLYMSEELATLTPAAIE